MGNSFTSTQIFDGEMLESKQFIENFCKKMADEGYVTCDSDESEFSYILRFADNCKWVTLASDAYEQGNTNSQTDTGRIAKMLKTTCVNITVIDSDCAIMDLYDKNGKKADTLIMGRADDYFGDGIPSPSEKIWKPFLCSESTWEEFEKVRKEEEVFVEDGLSKLAPLIGMDACNINFAAEDADEGDKYVVTLHFKKDKAITMSQNGKAVEKTPKKLTLKAVFKKVYGEALVPLGFIYAKTKNPCFLRLVNNDLVDIISLSDNGSTLGILSGVFTLYRNRVDLNDHSVDGWWLKDTSKFYVAVNPKYDNEYRKQIINFSFVRNDELSMYSAVEKSLAEVKKWVISVMDKVNNIKEFVYYRNRMSILQDYYAVCDKTNPKGMGSCCDGAVLFALEDPFFAPQCDKDYKLSFVKYAIEHEIDNYTMDKYDKLVEKINNDYDSVCELISYVMNNPEFYEQTKQELERRKKENFEILKNYGIKI